MVHGYYAVMGGFVFEIDPTTTEPFIPDITDRKSPLRLTITARGVLLLAKSGHIPHISEELIIDKSKANALAKTLVIFQATGSMLQVVARLAAHLPVTLLEVNTLGHVLCALTLYLCWWSKPLDIRWPTVISGEWIPPICAYMWMSSKISGGAPASKPMKPELRSLLYNPPESTEEESGADVAFQSHGEWPSTGGALEPSASITTLAEGQTLPDTGFQLNRQSLYRAPPGHVSLRLVDIRRWKLASEALRLVPAVRANYTRFCDIVRSAGDELLVERTPNLSEWDLPEDEDQEGAKWPDIIPLFFGSITYGGLHVAAWNAFFPTMIERLIWRISSLYITSVSLLFTFVLITMTVGRQVFHWRFSDGNICVNSFILLFLTITLGYALCKFFLLLEAFVSIRELPPHAYKTPQWTQLIPHF
jgi:hypothetical protein